MKRQVFIMVNPNNHILITNSLALVTANYFCLTAAVKWHFGLANEKKFMIAFLQNDAAMETPRQLLYCSAKQYLFSRHCC